MFYMIVLGNIIALIASLIMVYTGIIKQKKKILFFQTLQIGLFILSNAILGGVTGIIINAISLFRNILCYKDKLDIKWKFIITVLSITLTFKFNNHGFIGLMPLISTITYIWYMNVKSIKKFKLLMIFTMLLWIVYDIYIKSYTSALFDLATIIANIITIYKIKKAIILAQINQ